MDESERFRTYIDEIISHYHSGKLPIKTTKSSTCDNGFIISPQMHPSRYDGTLFVSGSDDDYLREKLLELYQKGYFFTKEDVQVSCSIHQNHLRAAKEELLKLLSSGMLATPYDLESIILKAGTAITKQLDINPAIHSKGLRDDIHSKLEILGLIADDPDLFNKHKDLNRFYNATKHGSKRENQENEELLKSRVGLFIAIDYFETIIRIFRWYYTKYSNGIPNWIELEDIDYSNYRVAYHFDYSKRW